MTEMVAVWIIGKPATCSSESTHVVARCDGMPAGLLRMRKPRKPSKK